MHGIHLQNLGTQVQASNNGTYTITFLLRNVGISYSLVEQMHCEVKYSLIFFYHCHMQIKLSSQRRRSTDLGALAHQPRHLVPYRFD
jgi:hypothetical protein